LSRYDPERAEYHAARAAAAIGTDRGVAFPTAQATWAQALADGGDFDAAHPRFQTALEAMSTVPNALAEEAAVRNGYGAMLHGMGWEDEAEAEYRAAADLAVRADDLDMEASALQNLATLLVQVDRPDEAIVAFRNLIRRLRERGNARSTYSLGFAQVNLANALSNEGLASEALAAYREAIATMTARLGAEHPEALAARISLALHLNGMGRTRDAAVEAESVLEDVERVLSADHPYTAYAQTVAGRALCDAGSPRRGAELQRASLDARRLSLSDDHWIIASAESAYGACLARLGQREEARGLLTRSAATLAQSLGDDHRHTRAARERLAAFDRSSSS
ncbi:tetratricopeptide repeat protein, partial [Rubrivirga sp.]|uniref:tetratricopeptide repeat protein n=1 Tax=Rubrivirga sp. TaxID=1885344 RepID=UPI003C7827D4